MEAEKKQLQELVRTLESSKEENSKLLQVETSKVLDKVADASLDHKEHDDDGNKGNETVALLLYVAFLVSYLASLVIIADSAVSYLFRHVAQVCFFTSSLASFEPCPASFTHAFRAFVHPDLSLLCTFKPQFAVHI